MLLCIVNVRRLLARLLLFGAVLFVLNQMLHWRLEPQELHDRVVSIAATAGARLEIHRASSVEEEGTSGQDHHDRVVSIAATAGARREIQRASFAEEAGTSGQGDVLINTYMRSGSSFLGRMLGFRSDAFYVYEPLWGLARYQYFAGNSLRCETFTPSCKASPHLRVALRILEQYYDCTFYDNPAANILSANINVKLSGPRWRLYKECRSQRKTDTICLAEMARRVCATSRHRVAKVLRISLDNVEALLNSRPNLKVIHLFRDPRAIISSHLHTSWSHIKETSTRDIANAAQAICKRIAHDVRAGEHLKEKFPARFRIVQYEDFDDPLSKIKILYTFLNMTLTNETLKYIEDPSYDSGLNISDSDDNGIDSYRDLSDVQKPIGGGQGNHPFQYRTVLKWRSILEINKYCSEVYDLLGYTRFTNEQEFRNMTVSAIKLPLPYTLTDF